MRFTGGEVHRCALRCAREAYRVFGAMRGVIASSVIFPLAWLILGTGFAVRADRIGTLIWMVLFVQEHPLVSCADAFQSADVCFRRAALCD